MSRRLSLLIALLGSGLAAAQEATDAGVSDAGVPEVAVVAPVVTPVAAPAPPARELGPPPAAAEVTPPSARTRMLNTWGFGFLGTGSVLKAVPTIIPTPTGFQQADHATVPLLGVRWWTPAKVLGLELGVGAMVSGSYSDQPMMAGGAVGEGPASTELLFHLSAPLVLGSTQHTIIFVAPEARAGLSRLQPDATGSGVITATTFDFSLKAGVEIFFSFIGLSNLSIEAGVRAGLVHEFRQSSRSQPLQPDVVSTQSQTRFATSLIANPWDLFTSTLAARYYF